ncbi:MAG: toll/interleukin-1 receptor domain-containing protein [Candidatus Binatia bacterium]
MKVFMSYVQADKQRARELAERLSEAGLDVWDPNQELFPGDNWSLAIGKALQQSRAMVVLVSPDSVDAPSVRREIEYALGSANFEGRLIPVMLRPTKKIPWILRKLPQVKLNNDPEEATERILDILKAPRTPARPSRRAAAH